MTEGSSSVMDRRVKERLIGAAILTAVIVAVVPELLSGPKHEIAAPVPSAGPDLGVRTVTVDLATSKATPLAESPAAAPSAAETPAEPLPAAEPGARAVNGAPAAAVAPPPMIATLKAQQPPQSVPAPATLEESTAAPGPAAKNPASMRRPSAEDFRAVTAVPRVPAAVPRQDPAGAAAPGRWSVQVGSFSSRANADKVARQVAVLDGSVYVTSTGRGSLVRYRVRVGPLPDRAAAERTLARLRSDGLAASLVPP